MSNTHATGTPHALELRNLRKSFGKSEIIRGVNLAVQPGERVAIIGPNGAGKSTLFNLISGRFEASSGEVLLHGHDITGKRPFEINRMGLSRSAVEPGLPVHVPEVSGQSGRCQRAGRGADAHDQARPQA